MFRSVSGKRRIGKKKVDEDEMLMAEISAPEAKKAKPKSKEINFSKPISFTNSANAAEFPSLDEASKMKFVSKKEEPKKEAPKKVTEETTSIPMFTNTKKSSDKPSFVELEKLRESSGKGELTSDPYKDKSREFKVKAQNYSRLQEKKRSTRIRSILGRTASSGESTGTRTGRDRAADSRSRRNPSRKPRRTRSRPRRAKKWPASPSRRQPRLRLGPLKHCMNRNFR
eukprot:TRINITY_DN6382_c0_g2_i5.p2 TRINITY_DN6382_c0_g2~~TRINITY_DN6382_c0_g2_i5.p2  ORF type:complete len:227 (+),score=32.87 TRINITY_DN6382_c0_g2_i5:333-1013(+)